MLNAGQPALSIFHIHNQMLAGVHVGKLQGLIGTRHLHTASGFQLRTQPYLRMKHIGGTSGAHRLP